MHQCKASNVVFNLDILKHGSPSDVLASTVSGKFSDVTLLQPLPPLLSATPAVAHIPESPELPFQENFKLNSPDSNTDFLWYTNAINRLPDRDFLSSHSHCSSQASFTDSTPFNHAERETRGLPDIRDWWQSCEPSGLEDTAHFWMSHFGHVPDVSPLLNIGLYDCDDIEDRSCFQVHEGRRGLRFASKEEICNNLVDDTRLPDLSTQDGVGKCRNGRIAQSPLVGDETYDLRGDFPWTKELLCSSYTESGFPYVPVQIGPSISQSSSQRSPQKDCAVPQVPDRSEPFLSAASCRPPCVRLDPSSTSLCSDSKASKSRRNAKNDFLVRCKLIGMSYRVIKAERHFKEAESTLRGRFRTLTKSKEHRVRKPQWQEKGVRFLIRTR